MRLRLILIIFTATLALTAAVIGCSRDDVETPATVVVEDMTPAGNSDDAGAPVILLSIGMHIEPNGGSPSSIITGLPAARAAGSSNKKSYYNLSAFDHDVAEIRTVAGVIEAHGGRMTVQAQTPFTTVAIESGDAILADLAAAGHEMGLHFHEKVHLGRNPESLPADTWYAVMTEEIELLKQASGVEKIRYFSGGNLYPDIYEAASRAGLDIHSDWKNPDDQSGDPTFVGLNPWRPAGGTDGADFAQVAAHDPAGGVIYLAEGIYNRSDFTSSKTAADGDDEAYFEFLKASLMESLAQAEAGEVNAFDITIHPGEYKGTGQPYAVIDRFLTEVVDPLVATGQLRWATYSEKADAYGEWEASHPGVDLREPAAAGAA